MTVVEGEEDTEEHADEEEEDRVEVRGENSIGW